MFKRKKKNVNSKFFLQIYFTHKILRDSDHYSKQVFIAPYRSLVDVKCIQNKNTLATFVEPIHM